MELAALLFLLKIGSLRHLTSKYIEVTFTNVVLIIKGCTSCQVPKYAIKELPHSQLNHFLLVSGSNKPHQGKCYQLKMLEENH